MHPEGRRPYALETIRQASTATGCQRTSSQMVIIRTLETQSRKDRLHACIMRQAELQQSVLVATRHTQGRASATNIALDNTSKKLGSVAVSQAPGGDATIMLG